MGKQKMACYNRVARLARSCVRKKPEVLLAPFRKARDASAGCMKEEVMRKFLILGLISTFFAFAAIACNSESSAPAPEASASASGEAATPAPAPSDMSSPAAGDMSSPAASPAGS
ncbi:MAG: hypothetical protein ACRETL_10240 [Gammaproteobacteria bacterium]